MSVISASKSCSPSILNSGYLLFDIIKVGRETCQTNDGVFSLVTKSDRSKREVRDVTTHNLHRTEELTRVARILCDLFFKFVDST